VIVLLALGYIGITYFIWKWLLPGQLASAISNWYLFVLCVFWPVWVALMLAIDLSIWIWPPSDDTRAFEDIEPADSDPRKKKERPQ
jgi:hypothetical protein